MSLPQPPDQPSPQSVAEALRESAERLRLAHQAAGIGAFEWNIQTGVNVWTPELEAMYGLARGEFGKTQPAWEQLVHPEDRVGAVSLVNETFKTGEPVEGEWRVVWRDGSVHWIAGRFQAFNAGDGKPLRLIGVNLDVTRHKQAEELARQRLAEIQDLYHNAPVGLCVLDRNLRFLRINERLAEINGIPVADHIGKTVRDLLPAIADTVEPGMRRILETGEPRRNIEIVSETPAHPGLERSWLEHWLPIKDSEGRVTALSIVVEEITQRKQAEEALRAANRELEEFNQAMVGRELRMVELKREINALCVAAGQPPRYDLDFAK